MKRLGILLAFVCCGASAAKADWEYTKWGMTPQQVAGAAKNRTKKSSDLHPDSDGNVTRLVAHGVDVDFNGVLEEPVKENWTTLGDAALASE